MAGKYVRLRTGVGERSGVGDREGLRTTAGEPGDGERDREGEREGEREREVSFARTMGDLESGDGGADSLGSDSPLVDCGDFASGAGDGSDEDEVMSSYEMFSSFFRTGGDFSSSMCSTSSTSSSSRFLSRLSSFPSRDSLRLLFFFFFSFVVDSR